MGCKYRVASYIRQTIDRVVHAIIRLEDDIAVDDDRCTVVAGGIAQVGQVNIPGRQKPVKDGLAGVTIGVVPTGDGGCIRIERIHVALAGRVA